MERSGNASPGETELRQGPVVRYLLWAKPYWGMVAFVIFLGMLTFVAPLTGPILTHKLLDEVFPGTGSFWTLELVVVVLVAVTIFGIAVSFFRDFMSAILGNRMMKDLRQQLYEHLQKMSAQFYDQRQVGGIVSRVIHDIGGAQNLIGGGLINLVLDLCLVIFAVGFLFYLNPILALVSFALLPFYYLSFTNMNVYIRLAWRAVHRQLEKISGTLVERTAGVRVVQAFTGERRERRRFKKQAEQHYKHTINAFLFSNLLGRLSETFTNAGSILIWFIGGYMVLDGKFQPGELIAFQAYVSYLYGPLQRFADVNVTIQNSVTNIERIFEMFDEQPAVTEKENALPITRCQGHIVFENVSYRYVTRNIIPEFDEQHLNGDQDIVVREKSPKKFYWLPTNIAPKKPVFEEEERIGLENVSFEAKPGQVIALVGPSGAGKSTLINFIPRFYDPDVGRILLDGHDLRDYRIEDLRKQIALVLQDNILFSGTIRENLMYGREDATEEEMIQAAIAANAHDFIIEHKDGYDAKIGERGMRLSGGQKQRLAIARALLKDPQILILDEATSALDAESEALVTEALERLMVGRTTFIIAHRLATVVRADQILVLDQGRIIQRGTHGELLRQGGMYRKLYEQQLRAMRPEELELALSQ